MLGLYKCHTQYRRSVSPKSTKMYFPQVKDRKQKQKKNKNIEHNADIYILMCAKIDNIFGITESSFI